MVRIKGNGQELEEEAGRTSVELTYVLYYTTLQFIELLKRHHVAALGLPERGRRSLISSTA